MKEWTKLVIIFLSGVLFGTKYSEEFYLVFSYAVLVISRQWKLSLILAVNSLGM